MEKVELKQNFKKRAGCTRVLGRTYSCPIGRESEKSVQFGEKGSGVQSDRGFFYISDITKTQKRIPVYPREKQEN